ncbi:hypothetical protein F4778DRAFT_766808 [Xylariomycetidae sp. FL2044]|nr:hypothetical protein F4778DRAFT_766808 [Xylariomycetidae sp. FL2044]
MLVTRSHMFFLSALLAFVDALASRLGTNNSSSTGCRAVPGSSSWPSLESWSQFNQSTGGKVFSAGTPPAAVCHPGQLTYDADECATISAAWSTYVYQQDQPISGMWQQYNNDTCLPNPNAPCSPDGYPAYFVNATTPNDVKLSFEFARAHNVRVVVKSSGHDYQGRSQAPGALSIWVHHMQDMTTHTSFQPEGCNFTIDSPAVTIGGAARSTVVGGGSSSVSVGGYITGGGHSLLAPRYGLAADQVLQLDLVTPMGEILTANECQNQDLFWAMRGGGGSTFGVMTSMVAGELGLFTPDLKRDLHIGTCPPTVLSQFPVPRRPGGVSGYSVITRQLHRARRRQQQRSCPPPSASPASATELVLPLDTQDTGRHALASSRPSSTTRTGRGPPPDHPVVPGLSASFWDWFQSHDDPSETGYDLYVGSRLLGADALTADPAAVAAAFKALGGTAYLVAGRGGAGCQAQRRGERRLSGLEWKAWCMPDSVFTNILPFCFFPFLNSKTGSRSSPLDPAARAHALEEVNARNNPGEPDWQHAFWGDNYRRLLQIKRRVDPVDVLWCHPCVGNDRWEQVGYQLCRIGAEGHDEI